MAGPKRRVQSQEPAPPASAQVSVKQAAPARPASPWPARALLCCAVLAVYAPTLSADFAFDDNFAVLLNPGVTKPGVPFRELLLQDFWGTLISSSESHKSWR